MVVEAPTRPVLDGTAARVLSFLIGINASVEARAALMARGYTQTEHERMWALLGRLSQLPQSNATFDSSVVAAVGELNAWDEPNFACIAAILARTFPDQAAFVFQDLAPSSVGAEAVMGIATLLDRLDALDSSPARKATRKVDHQAIARLGERGYTKAERDRLRALVATAQTVVEVEPLGRAESDAIETELYGFLVEWSTQAKVVIKRRDILIRLGIGKRKKRSVTPPTPPAPTPTPAPVLSQPAPTPAQPPSAPSGLLGAPPPVVTAPLATPLPSTAPQSPGADATPVQSTPAG